MADFINVNPVKFWCQKVLPLVYDDSLSYYELLGKVVNQLNEVIANNNQLPDYIKQQIELYISSGEIEAVLSDVLGQWLVNVKMPPDNLTAAKGDGATNDHDALQAILNYAANKNLGVFFPGGTYLTTGLTLPANCTLIGSGTNITTVSLIGGGNIPLISGPNDNLRITGIKFDGNIGSQTNDITLINFSGQNLSIDNCELKSSNILLAVTGAGANNINNIVFGNAVREHLLTNGSGETSVNNCVFYDLNKTEGLYCWDNSTNDVVGVGLIFTDATYESIYNAGNNCNISGCSANTSPVVDMGYNNIYLIAGRLANFSTNEIILKPEKAITYKTPTKINNSFSYVPAKDYNGVEYKILVEGANLAEGTFINVVEMGVDNTGATDVTEQLNAIIAAHKKVYFPAGTYLISDVVRIVSDSYLLGDMAIIKGSSNANNGFYTYNYDNITIDGFEFTNLRRSIQVINTNNITIRNIYGHDPYRNPPEFEDCYFITFVASKNVVIENLRWEAILENSDCMRFVEGCENVRVNNVSGYCYDDFIALAPNDRTTTNMHIKNFYFSNIKLEENNFCGVRIYVTDPASSIDGVTFENCSLRGDTRQPVRICNSSDGQATGGTKTNYSNISFINCRFEGNSTSQMDCFRVQGAIIDKLSIVDCVFVTTNAVTTSRIPFINIIESTCLNMYVRSSFYVTQTNLQEILKVDANSEIRNFVADSCYFPSRATATNTCAFEFLGNGTAKIVNNFVANLQYVVSPNANTTVWVENNQGGVYTANPIGGFVLGCNNNPTTYDVTGTPIRIKGMLSSVVTPSSPVKGDYYIDMSTTPPTLKIYPQA